jgi:hypothetical protein
LSSLIFVIFTRNIKKIARATPVSKTPDGLTRKISYSIVNF